MISPQYNSLKLLSDCPVCRRKHFPAEIKLIEEREDGHLLHIRCKNCRSCLLVYVMLGEHGVNLLGVLTDLGSEEVGKFSGRGSIDSDELIELHQLIKKNKFIEELTNVK
ncbi:hypothetical protein KKC32_03855 [Patescibacteria group bacterium]|nr:hypothetical protein [Patescibacteria group bacterium]